MPREEKADLRQQRLPSGTTTWWPPQIPQPWPCSQEMGSGARCRFPIQIGARRCPTLASGTLSQLGPTRAPHEVASIDSPVSSHSLPTLEDDALPDIIMGVPTALRPPPPYARSFLVRPLFGRRGPTGVRNSARPVLRPGWLSDNARNQKMPPLA